MNSEATHLATMGVGGGRAGVVPRAFGPAAPISAPPSPRTAAVHGTFHGVGCGLFEPVGRRMTETSEDDMGWKRVRLFMGWTPRVHRVPTAHGLSYLEIFFLLKRKKKTKKGDAIMRWCFGIFH